MSKEFWEDDEPISSMAVVIPEIWLGPKVQRTQHDRRSGYQYWNAESIAMIAATSKKLNMALNPLRDKAAQHQLALR